MDSAIVIDIETNGLHPDKIWCLVGQDVETGEVFVMRTQLYLDKLLAKYDRVIGHNIISFDAPQIEKIWGIKIPHEKLMDTLILSQLARPDRDGGHSLGSWGARLKFPKGDFNDWSGYSAEMLTYCKQDVSVTVRLYNHLRHELKGFSMECITLEHDVKRITCKQERDGFFIDQKYAMDLVGKLERRLNEIREQLRVVFPPIRIETQLKTKLKVTMQDFNVGSRKQIAERLMERGWKPKKKTDKGSVIVDEAVLNTINMPEAKVIAEYLMLQKRIAQVTSWLDALDSSFDNRVHGSVLTLRTITGRMAHAKPNMAQVPAGYSPYGKECRTCWTVPKGKVLVGIDASGIELRMLAHYMRDPDYTQEILNGDIHTLNQTNAGLETRDQAKTFIYAFLYGAGSKKIGSIVGSGSKKGKELIDNFLEQTPSLALLRNRVTQEAGRSWLRGLDNRKIWVRSAHSALNTKLQGAAAVVMKKALVLFANGLDKNVKIVANVHDEWQVECDASQGNLVGKLGVDAIIDAGKYYKLNCPLDGEYKLGNNWSETH
jgi:DNA polymerase-1